MGSEGAELAIILLLWLIAFQLKEIVGMLRKRNEFNEYQAEEAKKNDNNN